MLCLLNASQRAMDFGWHPDEGALGSHSLPKEQILSDFCDDRFQEVND